MMHFRERIVTADPRQAEKRRRKYLIGARGISDLSSCKNIAAASQRQICQ